MKRGGGKGSGKGSGEGSGGSQVVLVTYMLTFATVIIGYSYFVLTGSEYTFEGLRRTLEKRKLAKLLRRKHYDEATFRKLQEAVLMREEEVKKLLEEIKHDPVSLHLKDPSSPIVPPKV